MAEQDLYKFLEFRGEKVANEPVIDRLFTLGQGLLQHHGGKLTIEATIKAIEGRFPIDTQGVNHTMYKILLSESESGFRIGDCVLPTAIFAAVRILSGEEVQFAFQNERDAHPYIFVADNSAGIVEVHFNKGKDDMAKGICNARPFDYFADICRRFILYRSLKDMIVHSDLAKIFPQIIEAEGYLFDKKTILLAQKEMFASLMRDNFTSE